MPGTDHQQSGCAAICSQTPRRYREKMIRCGSSVQAPQFDRMHASYNPQFVRPKIGISFPVFRIILVQINSAVLSAFRKKKAESL
jgi:hypothetical protein